MEIQLPEIIDRITILILKIERSDNFAFVEELNEYNMALKDYEDKGVNIKQEWFDRLFDINSYMWDLFSQISYLKKRSNLKEIGTIYIELLKSNKIRIAQKNKIVDQTGVGFKDIKIN